MSRSYLVPSVAYALSVLSCIPAAQADYIYNGNYVTYCGQYDAVNTTSGLYDIINNAWGDDGSGLTCTTVGKPPLKQEGTFTNQIDVPRRKHRYLCCFQLDLAVV